MIVFFQSFDYYKRTKSDAKKENNLLQQQGQTFQRQPTPDYNLFVSLVVPLGGQLPVFVRSDVLKFYDCIGMTVFMLIKLYFRKLVNFLDLWKKIYLWSVCNFATFIELIFHLYHEIIWFFSFEVSTIVKNFPLSTSLGILCTFGTDSSCSGFDSNPV